MFETVAQCLRRLLRPHRLAVVLVIDGGCRTVEIGRRGAFHAAVDLTGLGRLLGERGLTPDAFAADLARRVIDEYRGRTS